ncbi:MAG: hypothetical protein ACRC2T_03915 [Thermoguttaceae bacterium]
MHEQNLSFLSWKLKIFISATIMVCACGTAAFFPSNAKNVTKKTALNAKNVKNSDLTGVYKTASKQDYDEDFEENADSDANLFEEIEPNKQYAKNFSTEELREIEKESQALKNKQAAQAAKSEISDGSEEDIMKPESPQDQYGKYVEAPSVGGADDESRPERSKLDIFMKTDVASLEDDEKSFNIIPTQSDDSFDKDAVSHFAEKPPLAISAKAATVDADSIVHVPTMKPLLVAPLKRIDPRVISTTNANPPFAGKVNDNTASVTVAADEITSRTRPVAVSTAKAVVVSADEIVPRTRPAAGFSGKAVVVPADEIVPRKAAP